MCIPVPISLTLALHRVIETAQFPILAADDTAAHREGTTLYTPAQYTSMFADSGEAKTRRPAWQIITLAFLAGFFIALAGAVASTAAHAVDNVGLARLVAGLLFPFGLIMVILTGAELYTGDTLMAITLKEKRITLLRMLYHWLLVFGGNTVGAFTVAIGMAYFGQMNYSNGGLAVFTIKQAVAKSTMNPLNAFVLGIFRNVLVAIESANWSGFLTHNLLPVTAGNTLGGLIVGWLFYWCHMHYARQHGRA